VIDTRDVTNATVIGGVLQVDDNVPGGSDDDLVLSRNGANVRVHSNNLLLAGAGTTQIDEHTIEADLASVTSMSVRTRAGDDRLTVDFSGGNPLPAGGLAYDGGDSGTAGDELRVVGTAVLTAAYRPDSVTLGTGRIDVNGPAGRVTFVSVEQAVRMTNLQGASLVSPGNSDDVAVAGETVGGVQAATISGTCDGQVFRPLTVYDVVELVLDLDAETQALPGGDRVELGSSPVARGMTALALYLGLGTDELEAAGPINLGSTGQFRVFGDQVQVGLASATLTAERWQLPTHARLSGSGSISGLLVGGERIEATGDLVLGTGGLGGFNFAGTLVVHGFTVTLNAADFARLGTLTTLDGGMLDADHGVSLPAGSTLQGTGTVAGPVAAQVSSTIAATEDLVLGDAASYAGFFSDGGLNVGPYEVTIQDRDAGVLGSYTALGDSSGPGTLRAPHGLLLENGKTLAGYGVVHDAFENQGRVVAEGPLPADRLEFTGDVRGAGDFDGNVLFSGTYSPGNSPAEIPFGGSVTFAPTATLYVELGGLTPGSQFDRLDAAGTADLGGALNVSLIGGFVPAVGNRFEIISAGTGVSGGFSTEILPTLPAGSEWEVQHQAETVTLVVVPDTLFANRFTATSTGFTARFNRDFDPSVLNLYDSAGGLLGAADVMVVGTSSGTVRGSLILSAANQQITFVRTGGPLAADTYTVTLRSAVSGFREPGGGLLDGNADGTVGDDFTTIFTVAASPADEVVVSISDFGRGYGQPVNLPRTTDAGVPITLSTGQNVSRVVGELAYDPALLSVTGFSTAIAGANSQFEVVSAGRVRVTVSSSTEFSTVAGAIELGRLTAGVPDTAPYASKHVLDLQNVQVFDATPNDPQPRSARDDDGVHLAAYFGDTTGNGLYSGSDVTLLQRVVVGSASGFAAYRLADPRLVADINGSGAINGSDVTFLQRVVVGTPVSFVPPLPVGLPAAPAGGPDPRVWIPTDLRGIAGQTVTVPVNLTVTEPAGITLSNVDLVINYLNAKSPLSPTLSPEYRGEGVAWASRLASSAYYDVNQDGRCTPLDAPLVINQLNAQGTAGEGEAAPGLGTSAVRGHHADSLPTGRGLAVASLPRPGTDPFDVSPFDLEDLLEPIARDVADAWR
jgi:hypothetical protein